MMRGDERSDWRRKRLERPREDRGRQFEEGDATEKRSDRLGVGPREATGMDSRPELVLEQSARNERLVP